ncbi:polyprenyl synthetase family protein [Dactylosporangium sp. NBC_01737]|uniref:polyprenyl synthetase family protein n=1 Tax=Dactylosporangium sp. NBC_01737 TaxID=2975959 RepID=UPI002E13B00C|nr:polyprenyl synthetase family protein [Dactylosporangium sp. NBC_01737]
MVTVLRTVDDVLAWTGLLVEPPLRTAVGRLPAPSRDVAELQLGRLDEDPPGVRTRAALSLVCAGAVGGDPHDAVAGAVAVELVHHWSLLQQDLFDGDLTRRHRPTAWSVVGPHPATLGGEAMLALAFDVAATGDPTRRVPRPLRQATRDTRPALVVDGQQPTDLRPGGDRRAAGGGPRGADPQASDATPALSGTPAAGDTHKTGDTRAIGGMRDEQATRDRFVERDGAADPCADGGRQQSGAAPVDRAGVRVLGDTVQQLLHSQHTVLGTALDTTTGRRSGSDLLRECITAVEQRSGALLGCACALGAIAGGGDPARVEQLRLFGVRLGLAVQFTEDLLGIWGDPAVTGRPTFPTCAAGGGRCRSRRRSRRAPTSSPTCCAGTAGWATPSSNAPRRSSNGPAPAPGASSRARTSWRRHYSRSTWRSPSRPRSLS